MSYKFFSESDIRAKIQTVLRNLVSDDSGFCVEPFDSVTLFSSIPSEDQIVIKQLDENNAIVQLASWLVLLLIKPVSGLDLDTPSLAYETVKQLLSSFYCRLKEVPEIDIETICFNIKYWFEFTGELVNSVEFYCNDEAVISTVGERGGSSLSDLLPSMSREEEHLFDELAKSNYGEKFSNVVLYNFWGDVYSNRKKSIDYKLPMTTEEKEISYNVDNRRRFSIECERFFINTKLNNDSYQATIIFEKLFKDYISRIRETLQDNAVLAFASFYWNTITTLIMGRVWHYLTSYEDVQDVHLNYDVFNRCCQVVKDICEEYSLHLIPGRQYCEWDTSLRELNIPYSALYEIMTKEDKKFFIPSSLPLNKFILGIEEANIKPLYESVEDFCKANNKMNSGKLGCIKYLVSELGNQLGEEWFEKAAESISGLKGSAAKNCMRNHTDTRAIKEFSEVLHNTVPNLPWREKAERRRE